MAKVYIPDGKGNYIPFPVLKGDKGDKGDKGQDGADVEFSIIEGFLCYRYPEQEWIQIISVESITGPKGDTGTLFVPSIDEEGNVSWSNDAELENPETVNVKGNQGEKGEPGGIFIPTIDESGNLSWSNDAGLENPATVNLKGEKGEQGNEGYTPIKGTDYFTPEEIENIRLDLETMLKQYIDEKIAENNANTEEKSETEEEIKTEIEE